MKKLTSILFILLFITYLNAQDYNKQINAFKESYVKEKSGKISEAIAALKAVYDEDSYEINLRLGWLKYQQKQYSESYTYYSKACKLMPYAIEPLFGIVLPAAAMGKWDQVISYYNKILSIDPNNALALYRLGLIYYERKEYNQAYHYFEKVVNLYPWDYDSLLMFAWTNLMLGKSREAKIFFNKVLLYSPDDQSAKQGLNSIK